MANANSTIHVHPKIYTFFSARTHRRLSKLRPIRLISVPTINLLAGFPLVFASCKTLEAHDDI